MFHVIGEDQYEASKHFLLSIFKGTGSKFMSVEIHNHLHFFVPQFKTKDFYTHV